MNAAGLARDALLPGQMLGKFLEHDDHRAADFPA